MNSTLTSIGTPEGSGSGTFNDTKPIFPPKFSKTKWLTIHALTLVALSLCFVFDSFTYQIANTWYNGPTPLRGEVHQLILSLAMYGQTLGIVTAIFLILLLDYKRRGRALVLGVILIMAGIGSSSVKAVVGRERPLESAGLTNFRGATEGLQHTRNQSFPSGHTATAFALSCTLSLFYPRLRPLLWTFALGVGLNRIVTVRHFPSDVIAGAWLGYCISYVLVRKQVLWDIAEAISDMLDPEHLPRSIWPSINVPRIAVRHVLFSPILLFGVSLTIHLIGNGRVDLWDRDEPRFATATREMMSSGDWIVPHFNGDLRPDKPILIYWLMSLSYSVFGDNPFGARFFSGIAGTCACLVTYFLGKSMFGKRVGLLAGWMLAVTPMQVIESKLATVDALLLFTQVVAFACLWKIYSTDESETSTAMGLWAILGVGVLVKGPVALAIPLTAIISLCLISRTFVWLKRLCVFRGIVVLCAIVLPWCIAVQMKSKGEFLAQALGRHVLERSISPMENHSGFPGYYVLSAFALLAPWSFLIPFAVRGNWTDFRSDKRTMFLLAWITGPLVMFELIRTKLVHYYLPAYPGILLLLSYALVGKIATLRVNIQWLNGILWKAMLAVSVVGLVCGSICTISALPESLQAPAICLIYVLCLSGILAALFFRQNRPFRGLIMMTAGTAMAFLIASDRLLPAVSSHRVILQVADRLKEEAAKDTKLALWLYRDPSIIYNSKLKIPVVDPLRDAPEFEQTLELAQKHGRILCPMTPQQYSAMRKDVNLKVSVYETITTCDLNGLKPRSIHLVSIEPAPHLAGRKNSNLK